MSQYDEFDAFLVSSIEHDKQKFENKTAVSIIQVRISDALKDAGHIPIDKNEDEIQDIIQLVKIHQFEHPEVTDDQAEDIVSSMLIKETVAEDTAIATIGLAIIASEERTDNPTQETLDDYKRKIYAYIVATSEFEIDHPMLKAFNALIPGTPIDGNAEYMMPYFASAIQDKEEIELKTLQKQVELESIIKNLGIKEDDPQWQDAISEAANMSLLSMPYRGSTLNRADLNALLYQQHSKLNGALRVQLINFFTNY